MRGVLKCKEVAAEGARCEVLRDARTQILDARKT